MPCADSWSDGSPATSSGPLARPGRRNRHPVFASPANDDGPGWRVGIVRESPAALHSHSVAYSTRTAPAEAPSGAILNDQRIIRRGGRRSPSSG